MANKERGEVSFQIEGQTYTLRLDLNALCEAEAVLSTPERMVTWQQALQMAERNSLSALRAILWASLQPHHPHLSLNDVGGLIQTMGGIPGIAKTLQEAIKNAMPAATGKQARPPKARSGGIGKPSSSEPEASESTVRRFGT